MGLLLYFLSEPPVFSAIGTAYSFLKLYDLPVRKWLTDHWLKRRAK